MMGNDIPNPVTTDLNSVCQRYTQWTRFHTNNHLVMSATTTDKVTLSTGFNSFVLDLMITFYFCCADQSITLSHHNRYMDFTYMFQFTSSQFTVQVGMPVCNWRQCANPFFPRPPFE